jgi:hypothetical protein
VFRCHFTKAGRIVLGENLEVTELAQAIAEGWRLLAEKTQTDDLEGFEIWHCSDFLFATDGLHGKPGG